MRKQQNTAAGWVGHRLAGHHIDALIGEGGMGVVYRATHLNLRRTVALKVLPPALAADAEYRRRFEREAAIAASLEHPAVVPIYDAGHESGVLYLSMRYVDGHDLGAVLQREGPLPVERLCALLAPVADALDAVHAAGLVHRDVKPGNILIGRPGRTRPGQVYLCDFGIAKGATAGGEITTAGQYVGTLQYSSPEQIQGRWIDGRSDQYGLACLAFRGLTGQVPYPHDDNAAIIYAHLAADPPRPGLLRALPAAVDAVVARAAAKDPDHRFPSCSAFVAALAAAASGRRPAARPPQRTAPVPARPVPEQAGTPRRHLPPTRPLPVPPADTPEAGSDTHRRVSGAASEAPAARPQAAPVSTAPTPGSDPPAAGSGAPAAGSGAPETGSGAPETGSGAAAPVPATPAAASGTPARGSGGPAESALPAPAEVRAERVDGDPSVTVTWTAGGPQDVEYKVVRLTPDGGRRVVGRTRTTCIIDGAVPAQGDLPGYEVVARLGEVVSAAARTGPGPRPSGRTAAAPDPQASTPAAPTATPGTPPPSTPRNPTRGAATPLPHTRRSPTPRSPADGTVTPEPLAPGTRTPGGIPAVRGLTVSGPGTLAFDWPTGITEAMVVVRRDRPPVSPGDPTATSWKITNMRYQLDGGLVLPPSVALPCHVAVASCRRERGVLVVSPTFGPTARTLVEP